MLAEGFYFAPAIHDKSQAPGVSPYTRWLELVERRKRILGHPAQHVARDALDGAQRGVDLRQPCLQLRVRLEPLGAGLEVGVDVDDQGRPSTPVASWILTGVVLGGTRRRDGMSEIYYDPYDF